MNITALSCVEGFFLENGKCGEQECMVYASTC